MAVAFDHRGVKLRERVLDELAALGHDVGRPRDRQPDAVRIDYPDKAREVGEAIRAGDAERGVLVCGSGVGASVAACKIDRHPRRDLPRRSTPPTRASSTTT